MREGEEGVQTGGNAEDERRYRRFGTSNTAEPPVDSSAAHNANIHCCVTRSHDRPVRVFVQCMHECVQFNVYRVGCARRGARVRARRGDLIGAAAAGMCPAFQ